MPNITQTIEERFWAKVDKSGGPDACWLWLAGKDSSGYGNFTRQARSVSAHRFIWEQVHGSIPIGMEVCHNCPSGDNPACVNPKHLWLGTHTDNMQDSSAKGRSWVGSRLVNAKLTIEQVQDIRKRYAAGGVTQTQLAAEYGVCDASINHIFTGRTFGWLP